jgi:hypothetical protein
MSAQKKRVAGDVPLTLSEDRHFLSDFKNSSLAIPACCMIEKSVPFLMASWRGTVILRFPSVKYM